MPPRRDKRHSEDWRLNIEDHVKRIAIDHGATVVGIGSRERLSNAPPSADPGYLLPSTRSVISFAIPYDRESLRAYFSKKDWRTFGDGQKSILKTLYGINDILVDILEREGHEALGVDTNCVYRPEPGAEDTTDMTEFLPDFSHQYGAVAAGLGRLGWSGNLLIPGYGAAVLLGTVLTSAVLEADPLCEENPCDRCGFCTAVCPVEMMDKRRSIRFFSDRDVSEDVIYNLVKTAGTAPSGAHKQPWTFVVVKDKAIKTAIREAAEKEERLSYSSRMSKEWLDNLAPLGTTWEKPFLEHAPYLIIVFKQQYGIDDGGNHVKHYYVSESVGIAVGILISAIHNAGLVTLTHTPSPMKFLGKILNRPKNETAFVVLPVGYPEKGATVPDLQRKILGDIMVSI